MDGSNGGEEGRGDPAEVVDDEDEATIDDDGDDCDGQHKFLAPFRTTAGPLSLLLLLAGQQRGVLDVLKVRGSIMITSLRLKEAREF